MCVRDIDRAIQSVFSLSFLMLIIYRNVLAYTSYTKGMFRETILALLLSFFIIRHKTKIK